LILMSPPSTLFINFMNTTLSLSKIRVLFISTGVSVFESKWCLGWLFGFKMHQKPFSIPLGVLLTTLPRCVDLGRIERGTPPPVPFHLEAFGASVLAYHFYAPSAPAVMYIYHQTERMSGPGYS